MCIISISGHTLHQTLLGSLPQQLLLFSVNKFCACIMAERFTLAGDQDYYKKIGLGHGASQDQIKKQLRRMSRLYHPDKTHTTATEDQMKELNKIRSVLLDAVEKKKYDEDLMNKAERDIPLFMKANRGSILLPPGNCSVRTLQYW